MWADLGSAKVVSGFAVVNRCRSTGKQRGEVADTASLAADSKDRDIVRKYLPLVVFIKVAKNAKDTDKSFLIRAPRINIGNTVVAGHSTALWGE